MVDMAESARVERYFQHVITDYICGDIRELLDRRLPKAAPLLHSVVSGIDTMGGMMMGFKKNNSGERSRAFMQQYFELSSEEANLIYSLVRCGISHEGVTKLAMRFFVHYARFDPGYFLVKSKTDHTIWLNVTELAWSYLDVIDKIEKDPHSHLRFVPQVEETDVKTYKAAMELVKKDTDAYPDLFPRAKFIRGGSGAPPETCASYFEVREEGN
jgi:hypothetical protein